jgi:REP element-mobilizing transposase RayT
VPRGPRVDAPGQVHHVIIRGVERRRIFRDIHDYEDLLIRLDRLFPALGFRCFAWVLMPNHAHFALQTGSVPLHKLMARLGTGFACAFNRRHQRVGHLLQNRYWSRPVDGDADLLNLVTYIHCNPLRAKLVLNAEALRRFPWTGHGALTGDRPARPFEDCSATLRLLAEQEQEARQCLLARMREADRPSEAAPSRCEAPLSTSTPMQVDGPAPIPPALDQLIEAVCTEHGLRPSDLGSRRRSQSVIEARGDVARRATRELGLPSHTVALALGVSNSTVSRALQR